MDIAEMKLMFDKLELVAKRLLSDQQEVITVIGMMRENFQLLESMAPPPAVRAVVEGITPVEYEVLVDQFDNGRMFCVARFDTHPEADEFVSRLLKLSEIHLVHSQGRMADVDPHVDLYNNPYRSIATDVKALFALAPVLKNTP